MISAGLRQSVRERGQFCCEYCHFPEAFTAVPFHFDHIIARLHGGKSEAETSRFPAAIVTDLKEQTLPGSIHIPA
jgi:hypothetical protein